MIFIFLGADNLIEHKLKLNGILLKLTDIKTSDHTFVQLLQSVFFIFIIFFLLCFIFIFWLCWLKLTILNLFPDGW